MTISFSGIFAPKDAAKLLYVHSTFHHCSFIGEISGFIRWDRTANAQNDVSLCQKQVLISLHFTYMSTSIYPARHGDRIPPNHRVIFDSQGSGTCHVKGSLMISVGV